MLSYIIRRLLVVPVIAFILILIVFALFYSLPPAVKVYAFLGGDKPPRISEINGLIKLHHLDQGFLTQFKEWLVGFTSDQDGKFYPGLLQGNLGWSVTAKMPVSQALGSFIPVTFELVIFSILPILIGGVYLGVRAAVQQNRILDQLTRMMSITAYSVPVFVLGLVLLLVFYGGFGLFGTGRLSNASNNIVQNPALWHSYTNMYSIDALLNGNWDVFWDAVLHLILPMITLSFVNWALLVRITRSSMLNTLKEDYVNTARAKGLKEKFVINKHAFRNALIPVITISTLLIGGLLSGLVITETVFGIRGVGLYFQKAATGLDIAGVLGFTIFVTILWVLTNLVADLMYAFVDPRVRLG
ncbi:ABC transporter permease [Candidatus Acetothermia bacterium]|nr:ABC transporter permease [Candidatus Acetothermia bacterium]MBI3643347.1 ABC transporter permease [Candidatus Acetothermia bacterium]